ncbi:MAG: signal peptide peptidase SppA [Acidobacteriota bacterium]
MFSRRLAIAVFCVVFLCIAVGLLVRLTTGAGLPRVAAGTLVLEIHLDGGFPEGPPAAGLTSVFSPARTTLRELVETIDRAAADRAVAGILARVGGSPGGMAHAQEVRDAVLRFRSHKKFAWAYSETFGETGNASEAYYLASAFDQIFLQPSGDLWLTGVALQTPFVRGTFDKLGVTPVFGQRYEYKNAVNFYTEKEFTAAHREAMEKLKSSWFAQIVRGVAQGRRLTEDAIRAAVDRAPLLGQEAVTAGLVDGLAYRDEVVRRALAQASGSANLVQLSRYRARIGKAGGRPSLALIYGVGEVVRGRGAENPFIQSVTMGSETVGGAFRAAADDPSVRAIVFRVDSPGGSYVASDTIWREVARAREKKKPVIVSMGDVAGSGGYFVAIGADKIVAQPGTITGSIGVFAGKFVLSGLFEKLGVSFDEVHAGKNSLLWDPTRDFSPSERERFDAFLDRIYDDFTTKVALGRRLPKERVLEIARGRIWTGEDAKALGLVDELGGMETAVRLAKRAAGIPAAEAVSFEIFPRPRTLAESIRERFFGAAGEEPEDETDAHLMAAAVRTLRPLARRMHALGLDGGGGALSMPPIGRD